MQNQIMYDSFGAHNSDDGANKQNSEEQNLTGQHNVVVLTFNTPIDLMFPCCKLDIRVVGN